MKHHLNPLALALIALPAAAQAQTPTTSVIIEAAKLTEAPKGSSVDASSLVRGRAATSDTASLLSNIPGVSLYGAGGVSSLPSIRGLADDRLRIKVDGMDLIAACPNHMNPPLSYLDPSQVAAIKVYAGITPVSVGGDSIGGSIIAQTPDPIFAAPGQGHLLQGQLGAYWRSNGSAHGGHLAATYATEAFSLSYSGAIARSDNYTAGSDFKSSQATGRIGHTLPLDEVGSSAYDSRNHNLGVAFRSGAHLVEAKLGYQDIPYQLWPNQRMDMLANTQKRVNLRYLGHLGWGQLEVRAYRESVDHFMDFGADKRYWYGNGAPPTGSGGPAAVDGAPCSPLSTTCAAGMPMYTATKTSGLSAKADVSLSPQSLLRVGAEYQSYQLDDWWPASGGGMWPNTFWDVRDGQRKRAALYSEWQAQHSAQWLTLAGVRYERVSTDAGPVQAYNNAQAPATSLVPAFNNRDRARSDNNLDLTALARYSPDSRFDIEFGAARKVRSPSVYERYAWYSRGMEMLMVNWFGEGNGYIGNMDLRPEKALTVSSSFDWHAADRNWEVKATPYHTHVTDYIDALRCPTSLGGSCTAANLTNTNTFVYLQFANQSARLYGLDLSGHVSLPKSDLGQFAIQGVVSYAKGKNRDSGDDLYNIMPLNGKLTLTHALGAWDSALEFVAVSAKTHTSDVRTELKTPGYSLMNLRASHSWKQVRLDIGIDNLFDKLYSLPLGGAYVGQGTTMTAQPVGSVPRWGTAVPGMGRSLHAGVTVKF